jgi:hypothetical protein
MLQIDGLTSKGIRPKHKRFVGDLPLLYLTDSLLFKDVNDKIVICIWHPLELSK